MSVNIKGDLCKMIPTPALVSYNSKLLPKKFWIFFDLLLSFKFTERRAVDALLSLYHVHQVQSKKLCDEISQYKNKAYHLFFKTKKILWSILSCKPISVFIYLKCGEFFFSIISLFKTASSLKLLTDLASK